MANFLHSLTLSIYETTSKLGLYKLNDISYTKKVYVTEPFKEWLEELDRSLKIRVEARIQRLVVGQPGVHKKIASIYELKWSAGAIGGFRVYYALLDGVVLLLGGHKDRQKKDIQLSKYLYAGIKNGTIRIKEYE